MFGQSFGHCIAVADAITIGFRVVAALSDKFADGDRHCACRECRYQGRRSDQSSHQHSPVSVGYVFRTAAPVRALVSGRILVAIDFSVHSKNALKYAVPMAGQSEISQSHNLIIAQSLSSTMEIVRL